MSWRIADQPRFARSTDACGGAALSRRISVGPARGRDSTTAVVADPEWLGIADPRHALRPAVQCRRPAAIARSRGAPHRGAAALSTIFRRHHRLDSGRGGGGAEAVALGAGSALCVALP